MSIVEQAAATAATKTGRVSYGIDICIGKTTFNEWGLSESEAKDVHELLLLNDDEPLPPTEDGIVYKRRPLSVKKQTFADMKVALLAKKAAAAKA